jgi:hypothetical protein
MFGFAFSIPLYLYYDHDEYRKESVEQCWFQNEPELGREIMSSILTGN